jgi:hypothetical protein
MVNFTINEISSKNKRPTLCLNMIVKNEAGVIIETLNNLTEKIQFDYWVISDTGSTDNTQQIISDYFLEKGIPGELFSHEWQDFGFNRTKALECAYDKTDYLLIFDADDKLHGDFKLPFDTKPLADRYMIKFGKGFEYMRPLLINNRKRWAFKGVLHEFLENLEPVNADINVLGDYHVESGRTGNRSQNPHKYRDDAIILKNAYEKEMLLPDKGMSGRYAFYCAQSFRDAGEIYIDDSIEWYKKCLEFENWSQEKYYSCLMIGNMYYSKNNMNALKYWLKTIDYDNERLEGVVHAMEFLRNDGQHLLVNLLYHKFKNYKKPSDKLFLSEYEYIDQIEYHNSISGYYMNDHESAYECCKKILISNKLVFGILKNTFSNLQFYKEYMNKDPSTIDLFYAVDNLIVEIKKHDEKIETYMTDIWNFLYKKNNL